MSVIHLDAKSGLPKLPDDGTGVPRLLGLLPPSGPMALPRFGDAHPLIPQDQWVPIDLLDAFKPPVLDQGQHGSCTGHGACTTFDLAWLIQGEDEIHFSACYIYGQINGGRDQGASISDTIQALQTKGVCLESTVPEGMIYSNRFPSGADAEASKYRLIDAYVATSAEEKATAIQMGFACADSVMVGRTFNNLNAEGVAGVDRGPGNHCTNSGGMKRLANGTWAFKHRNSWGSQWGLAGDFFTTEAHIQSQSYYECVVYRLVSSGPNSPKFVA